MGFDFDRLGIAAELRAQRDAVLSTARMSPEARARALGVVLHRPVAKEHRIVVDIKAATRTVETTKEPATPPRQRLLRRATKRLHPLDREPAPEVRKIAARQLRSGDILKAVADTWGLTTYALQDASRPQRVCRPRFAAALLLRTKRLMSFPEIARALKRKDHTSARHEVQRGAHLLATDAGWAELYHAADRVLTGNQ